MLAHSTLNKYFTQRNLIIGGVAFVAAGFVIKAIYDRYQAPTQQGDQKKSEQPPATAAPVQPPADRKEQDPLLAEPPAATSAVYLQGEKEADRKQLTLVSRDRVNHDSFIFKFSFDPTKTLGVPVGHHFRIFTTDGEGKPKHHTYTPISPTSLKGEVEVLVKVYFPSSEFPQGGVITQQLDKLEAGDTVTVGGPRGKFTYLGRGRFSMKSADDQFVDRQFSQVTYIVGGSAITPVIFLLRHAFADSEDNTQFTLVFSNKTRDDVLLLSEFQEMAQNKKLKLTNTLTRESLETMPDGFSSGRINQELIAKSIPAPSDDHIVFFCGPKGFDETAKKLLADLGHNEKNTVAL